MKGDWNGRLDSHSEAWLEDTNISGHPVEAHIHKEVAEGCAAPAQAPILLRILQAVKM